MGVNLKESLSVELKDALRAGEKNKLNTIRLIVSAVNYAEIEQQKELDDTSVHVVIAKMAKQRRESIEAFQAGNRPDLVAKEQAELDILEGYLPKQLSREEITVEVKKLLLKWEPPGQGIWARLWEN